MKKSVKEIITNKGDLGGVFSGPSHDDGGIPVTISQTGEKIEVEGNEFHLAPKALNDTQLSCVGTPSGILTQVNERAGGNKLSNEFGKCKLVNPEKDKGEKIDSFKSKDKPIVKIGGDNIVVPPGSAIINKTITSPNLKKIIRCSGSAEQVASAINSYNNHGVDFSPGGSCELISDSKEKQRASEDAPVILPRSAEKPPSGETRTKALGGNVSRSAYNKDSNKFESGGIIKKIKVFNYPRPMYVTFLQDLGDRIKTDKGYFFKRDILKIFEVPKEHIAKWGLKVGDFYNEGSDLANPEKSRIFVTKHTDNGIRYVSKRKSEDTNGSTIQTTSGYFRGGEGSSQVDRRENFFGRQNEERFKEGGNLSDLEKNNNLNKKHTKDEISNVLAGKVKVRNGDAIQAISSYLRRSQSTSTMASGSKLKREEERIIRQYKELIPIHSLNAKYFTEGTENRVFLESSGDSVIKLNSSYFYSSWENYFDSLLLHNYFFPETSYELIGFTEENSELFSVVRQDFVKITNEPTDLEKVKKFLSVIGFQNTGFDHYYNENLDILLEDLHNQNIIFHNGFIYFIDTIFFLPYKFKMMEESEYEESLKRISPENEKFIRDRMKELKSLIEKTDGAERAQNIREIDTHQQFLQNKINPKQMREGGEIPERYKDMGFSYVGQKKKSTRPEKKWMVLAKKGDKYKVVHGGQKGMEDFSQHRDKERKRRFWDRMGGFDSEKTKDPFSPLYWHKRFGTWESGGLLENDESYLSSQPNFEREANDRINRLRFLISKSEGEEKDYYMRELTSLNEQLDNPQAK